MSLFGVLLFVMPQGVEPEVVFDFSPAVAGAGRHALERAGWLLGCYQKALGHDLPNRLVALQGLARLAVVEYAGNLGPEGQDVLRRVADVAQEVDTLVRALAALGRVAAAAGEGPAVDPAEVACEAALAVRLATDGPVVRHAFAADTPALTVSRQALYQVLMQLLRNAAAAGVPGRPLEVEVGGRAVPGGAELWVADNGRGLSPERLHAPFDPAPSAAGGFGLGLFLVRQVVSGWGGAVRIRSAAGQGTTFAVRIPITPPD